MMRQWLTTTRASLGKTPCMLTALTAVTALADRAVRENSVTSPAPQQPSGAPSEIRSRIGARLNRLHMRCTRCTSWRVPSRRADPLDPRALLVIPPRGTTRELAALETAMQGLALPGGSVCQPIALEVVGTSTWRGFVVRAASPAALSHLAEQLRARYPQAELQPLAADEDPWRLAPDERGYGVELGPGGPAYLPLRTWPERQLAQPGTDPVLGLLASVGHLPEGARVVAQLGLTPAPDTWSRRLQRLAVEHPLEWERSRERWELAQAREASDATSSRALVILLAVVLAILALWLRMAPRVHRLLPAWLWQAGMQVLHGQRVTLTRLHLLILVAPLLGVALLFFGAFVALGSLHGRGARAAVYDMRLVSQKTTPIAYRARLRLLVVIPRPVLAGRTAVGDAGRPVVEPACAADADEARAILDRLVSAYRQYHLASGGFFHPRTLSPRMARRLLSRPGRWARGVARSSHLLSVEDVAGLWHLPQAADLADLPLVARTRARSLLAPPVPELAARGETPRLGVSRAGGYGLPVRLPPDALRRNALVVAKTGKGKSTLLLHLARAVMEAGAVEGSAVVAAAGTGLRTSRQTTRGTSTPGLVLIDPHGDLVAAALDAVPAARRDDVVLVDLADTEFPIALNPLDVTLGRDRDKAVENLLGLFAHVWTRFWGPRMENALEFALKSLYEANEALVAADPQEGPDRQYTLLDIAPVLSLPGLRHAVMAQLRDPDLLNWWRGYYGPLDQRLQLEIINPVLTKMAKFSGSRLTRRIVGQGRSTLNLTEIVREGRLLLVHTAREVVGADTAALVGATLLGLLGVAVAEQARLEPDQRRPVCVIVDEFQTIPGADYGAMLSELRKFGASFVLTTQALAHLDALDRTLRPTVLANVDHLFAFATSAEDARLLQRELDQDIEVADLVDLDDFACYAKLTVAGRRLPLFSLALDPPRARSSGRGLVDTVDAAAASDPIRARSRQRYARPRAMVEEALARDAVRRAPLVRRRPEGGGDASSTAEADRTAGSLARAPGVPPGMHGARGGGRAQGRGARAARAADGVGQLSLLIEQGLGPDAPLETGDPVESRESLESVAPHADAQLPAAAGSEGPDGVESERHDGDNA